MMLPQALARIVMDANPKKLILASDGKSFLVLESGIHSEKQPPAARRRPSTEPTTGKMTRYGLDGKLIEIVDVEHECLFGSISGDRTKMIVWGASRDLQPPVCRMFDLDQLSLTGDPWLMSEEHRHSGMNHDGSRWIGISRDAASGSGRPKPAGLHELPG